MGLPFLAGEVDVAADIRWIWIIPIRPGAFKAVLGCRGTYKQALFKKVILTDF